MPASLSKQSNSQTKNKSSLTTAVVAGGAGFIGSHLCSTLLMQNCRVIVLDNLVSGKEENLAQFKDKPNFSFIKTDLKKLVSLPTDSVDYIFHLAGLHYYQDNKGAEEELLLVNSAGTKNLLELAQHYQAKFLLGSTPEIYAGHVSSTNLAKYYGQKTEPNKNKLFEAKRFAEGLVQQFWEKHQLNSRIVRFFNVYGPKMDLNEDSAVSKLLSDWEKGGPLKITGDGLQPIYPTYISDLIYGLVKAMFSQSSMGKVYNLINLEKVTILNFAYALKKIKPVELEYVPDINGNFTIDEAKAAVSQKQLGWKAKVKLEEGIAKTLESLEQGPALSARADTSKPIKVDKDEFIPPTVVEIPVGSDQEDTTIVNADLIKTVKLKNAKTKPIEVKEDKPVKEHDTEIVVEEPTKFLQFINKLKHKKTKKRLVPSKLKKILIIFSGLLLIVLTPFLISGIQLFLVRSRVIRLADDVKSYDFQSVETTAPKTIKLINQTQSTSRFFAPYYSMLGLTQGLSQIYNLLGVAQRSSQLSLQAASALNNFAMMADIVWHNQAADINKFQQQLDMTLLGIFEQTSLMQTQLQPVYQSFMAQKVGLADRLNNYYHQLPQIREKIYLLRQINQILPDLLGFKQKKTYLVLLQNNMELRPTGGFIGSYGLITFDKGKLIDWQVFDVYDADGQLKGHVEPPESLKEYLGEANWFLRDSNWDPDFVLSAQRAEWFIDKEIGRQVDGVIALNLQTVQQVLSAIGPVYLADYDETIDESNIFERAEYYAEVSFFPGSTQKKDFLASLSSVLMENVKSLDLEKWPKLGDQILTALNHKDLLLYMHTQSTAQLFARYGWDGSMQSLPTNFINSNDALDYSDYLMVVDSNVGVNKANYFLSRQAEWKSTITKDGRWQKQLIIQYKNDSESESWPGGRYKNYLRILLSNQNQLHHIRMGEAVNNLTEVDLKEIDIEPKENQTVYGVYLVVPAGEERVVVVNYEDTGLNNFNKNNYRIGLYWQKQPGIGSDKISAEFNYPMFLQPTRISPQGQSGSQRTLFTTDLSQDREFYVELAK